MRDLKTVFKLKKIQKYIRENEFESGKVSWTKIERYSDVPDAWPAIEWGIKEGYIKNHKNNLYQNIEFVEIMEEDYYEFLRDKLEIYFMKQHKKGAIFEIAITARRDSKISGRWTRPDLVAYSFKKYPYIPDSDFDVLTFEVKRSNDISVLAVFESLAHRSAASKSYVVFPKVENSEAIDRIYEEAQRYGIGVIIINDPLSDDPIELTLDARKEFMDKEKASNFLQAVLTDQQLSTLTVAR